MARFLARGHFDLNTRDLFVIYGDILEGEIKHGMVVELPAKSSLLAEEISGIEFVDRVGPDASSHVALTIKALEPKRAELWRDALQDQKILTIHE